MPPLDGLELREGGRRVSTVAGTRAADLDVRRVLTWWRGFEHQLETRGAELGGLGPQLEDGARAAARELARGESAETAEQTARSAAGDEVAVVISAEGEYTRVVLTRPVRVLGLIQLDTELTSEASARTEHLAGLGGPE